MLKNAGKSRVAGLRLKLKAVPFTNFETWTTFGYNKAEFVEYIRSATLDYSGNVLPYVPEFTMSLGGNYTMNVNRKLLQKYPSLHCLSGFR
jgi:iron complex outermembrane recepter protein